VAPQVRINSLHEKASAATSGGKRADPPKMIEPLNAKPAMPKDAGAKP